MEDRRVKYPIGVQDFGKLISEGYAYVDKTAILHDLITSNSCCFLSRPRRFGKSLTLSTLQAYFEGRKDLFNHLEMSRLEKDWKKHPVFLLSFARFEKNRQDSIENILEFHLRKWEQEYGLTAEGLDFPNRFANIIEKSANITGQRAVVLIDEYDSALVSTLEDKKLHEHIRSVLKPVYTVIKDCDRFIRFSLITGVTRFSKLTIFSGLNNINDISLYEEYSSICGITSEELDKYFKTGIETLGREIGGTYNETVKQLKDYYDGYHFSKKSPDIYNPFSILNVLKSKSFGNYWYETGIPSIIVERMRNQDLDIERYINPLAPETMLKEADSAYNSDLAILFQAGFITIKGYDRGKNAYRLGIPNREVKEGMSRLFMETFISPDTMKNNALIFDLTDSIRKGDPEGFLNILKGFLAGVPFDLSKGDKEVYFHNAFYIVTSLIGLNVEAERHVSSGSIDIVLSTPDYVYVIEIKLNKKPQDAIDQINSKEYALHWSAGKREVFKIGVVFSSRTRTLKDCVILRERA